MLSRSRATSKRDENANAEDTVCGVKQNQQKKKNKYKVVCFLVRFAIHYVAHREVWNTRRAAENYCVNDRLKVHV